MLATLSEAEGEEAQGTDKLSFDQLLGALKSAGVAVPKSGTLKVMNKQRVLAKHHGQLVAPETVRGFLAASQAAIDGVLAQVIGNDLGGILLADLLDEGEAKDLLREACKHMADGDFLACLICVRQSIFVEVEQDYSIHDHKNGWSWFGGGSKAPAHTKDKDWIATNVKEPTSYVKIDSDNLRTDALEWGFNINDIQNLRRLTPAVFREDREHPWKIAVDLGFEETHATQSNAQYCLDRAIELVRRKHQHLRALRPWVQLGGFQPPQIFLDEPIYATADKGSEILHRVQPGFLYQVSRRCMGFDGTTFFLRLLAWPEGEETWSPDAVFGYLEDLPGRPAFVPQEAAQQPGNQDVNEIKD